MKKLLYSVAIITVLFSGSFFASAQSTTQVTADVNQTLGSGLTPCTDAKSADCYQLLEPLPQKQEDGTYKYINNFNIGTEGKDDKGIAGFINFMFEIGIGIAGVLGVVMLTIYGFQYASNDKNINTFAELKTKITNVIFGILLLLGIFIILRTINPDLLIVEPGIKLQYLSVDENGDGSADDAVDSNNYTPAELQASQSGLKVCTAGIVQVGVFDVCKTIAPNVAQMVAAAKAQNVTLTGGGFRTRQEQISLRVKNCGGNTQYNIFQKSAKQCNPQTAIPGTSRHENGLALDLKCDGVGKYAFRNTKCFTWMKNNAIKYGFKNLPAEPWHWSIDGH